MNAEAFKASRTANQIPRPLEIGARLVQLLAGNDVLANAIETVQHRQRRRIEYDRFLSSFAVGQAQEPAIKIDMVPLQVQNLPEPRASEQQEAQRRGGELVDRCHPVFRLSARASPFWPDPAPTECPPSRRQRWPRPAGPARHSKETAPGFARHTS